MMRLGRIGSPIAIACVLLLFLTSSSYPSYNSEASRKYGVACERLDGLKKSKRKKYRSYWKDCVRNFELVEKKYPKSPSAGDACFERAGLYVDMYQVSRWKKDITIAVSNYRKCLKKYPKHRGTPKALYDLIELYLDYKKDKKTAGKTYARLSREFPASKWTESAKKRFGLSSTSRKKETALRPSPRPRSSSIGTVKDIRHRSGGPHTRVVVDLDGPVTYDDHKLKNPDRLFFDIKNARIDPSLKIAPVSINDGILKRIRFSQYDPQTVRLVLDLASLKNYSVFPLPDPYRLVIDIKGQSNGKESQTSVQSDQTEAATEQNSKDLQETRVIAEALKNSEVNISRQLSLKVETIAIDAGHGGHDPGAIGKRGLKEKNVSLDIARRLSRLIKKRLNCKVVMIRDRDKFIELDERPAIAKSHGADLFISIHTNASRSRRLKGIETYIQGLQATDRASMVTAARENATSTKTLGETESEMKRIFSDLTSAVWDRESLWLANSVQSSLVRTVKPANRRVVDLGVKRAFFYVLINTEMPSILAEVGFISNTREERLLRQASYRQRIAEALYRGVKKYIDGRTPRMAGL